MLPTAEGLFPRSSRSPSPSPIRGWGAVKISTIKRDYRRHVYNIMEVYANDKRSLLLMKAEALKPEGHSELILEHGLAPPQPLDWYVMTTSVCHCAEALLARLHARLSNESSLSHSLTPRSSKSPPRGLIIDGYKKLVAKVIDVFSNTPIILLALLTEARSDGITPHLEAKGLLPPTDFSWELMMKIIEDEILRTLGPKISVEKPLPLSPASVSPQSDDSFREGVLTRLEELKDDQEAIRAIAEEAEEWSQRVDAPKAGKYTRNSRFISRKANALILGSDTIENKLKDGAGVPNESGMGALKPSGTPKRLREQAGDTCREANRALGSPTSSKEGSVWDHTEAGSIAPSSHRRASFPPPLIIRSFQSTTLKQKRNRTMSKRQTLPLNAPHKTNGELENKVGTLTSQVTEMMDLMKSLVSLKSAAPTSESELLLIRPHLPSSAEGGRSVASNSYKAPSESPSQDGLLLVEKKEDIADKGEGEWTCSLCTLVNRASTVTCNACEGPIAEVNYHKDPRDDSSPSSPGKKMRRSPSSSNIEALPTNQLKSTLTPEPLVVKHTIAGVESDFLRRLRSTPRSEYRNTNLQPPAGTSATTYSLRN